MNEDYGSRLNLLAQGIKELEIQIALDEAREADLLEQMKSLTDTLVDLGINLENLAEEKSRLVEKVDRLAMESQELLNEITLHGLIPTS